jgi:hypothetical protein
VPLDLTHDRRHGVGGEVAPRAVVAVHGLDQTHDRDLSQVVVMLNAAGEATGEAIRHRRPRLDRFRACVRSAGVVGGHRRQRPNRLLRVIGARDRLVSASDVEAVTVASACSAVIPMPRDPAELTPCRSS